MDGKIEWSFEARAFVCSEHGAESLFEKSAGYSRSQHMPLHAYCCRKCGAESEPAIHADLGL
jgi:hypothetical protein